MKKKKIFYGWWIVLGSGLIACTMVPLVTILANNYLLQITNEMNISHRAFIMSNVITLSLGIFLSPFIAKMLTKGNLPLIQSISIAGFALAYASYALAQHIYHIYLSSFFLGIFYLSATFIPISIMITNWFHKKRGLAMSIVFSGISVGSIIFHPIITSLLNLYGWRITYVLMALIVLCIALPISIFVLKKEPGNIGLFAYGADEKVNMAISQQAKSLQRDSELGLKQFRAKLFFFLLLIGMFLSGLIYSGMLGQFPLTFEIHDNVKPALLIFFYSFSGICGNLIYGWIHDKWNAVASIIFACIAFTFAVLTMLASQGTIMVYITVFLFGFGNVLGTIAPPLITAATYGNEKYGEVYGIVNSASQTGLSLGAILVTHTLATTGSYYFAGFLLLIFTAMVAITWIIPYLESKKYGHSYGSVLKMNT